LIISSITSSNVLFSISPTTETIAPDSTAIFYVQFSANDPGSQNGVLLFHHNGLTSPDSVFVHAEVITGITGEGGIIPDQYALYQNYPNPFNPTTTIKFKLPKASQVTLKVFNTLGEEVAILVSERLSASSYSYEWSRTGGMASGVYLYRLQAGDYVETKKMIILK